MTSAQKVIKYLATALGIMIIISIVTAIISAMSVVSHLSNNKNDEMIEKVKEVELKVDEPKIFKIDLKYSNLNLKVSDTFKIETNNKKVNVNFKNDCVTVKENDGIFNNKKTLINLYLPKKSIDEINIDMGAGVLNVDGINSNIFNLDLGAGKFNLNNLNVINKMSINGGAGNINITSSKINNLDADLGVGEFKFEGVLIGNNKVDAGVGNIDFILNNNLDNYTLDIDKGIGNIIVDNKKIISNKKIGLGNNYLKVDGGIGNISISSQR